MSPAEASIGAAPPARRDIVRRESRPKGALVRFVVGPDGVVYPDVAERLPGRGVWVEARRDAIEAASAKNLFARAAKEAARVPDGLADAVERQLTRRCLDLVGLARRAGEVVNGFDKVAAALRGGTKGLLLSAADGAADGVRKLTGLQGDGPHVAVFERADLGRALGRDDAVHVLVKDGPLARRLDAEAARLRGFKATPASGGPTERSNERTTRTI